MNAAIARRPPPLTPEWIPLELAFEHTKLWRFVILSLLLHALAILLFGAPSGGTREGRAMWGSLQVMLQRQPEPPPPPAPLEREAPAKAPPSASIPPPPTDSPERPDSFPQLLDRLPSPEIKVEPLPPLVVPPPTEVEGRAETPQVPSPLLEPLQALPKASELPALERVPDIRVPAEAPPIPAPLLQPIPQAIERSTLPPLERVPTFETPALPAERPAPRAPEPVRPVPEAVRPAPEPVRPAPEPVRPAPPAPQPATPEVVRPEAQPGRDTQRTPPASPVPSAPESVFRRREEPSAYDPTKPSLDAEALRKRASELGREGTGQRALLPFPMPPVAKPKSKLESAIENARKPDCRDAYKALGLAAVVPLIANEFGEGTCRW